MKLVHFLKKLRNEQVTIELKNSTTIWGTLQTVTPQMNVTLSNVTLSLSGSNNSQAQAGMYLLKSGSQSTAAGENQVQLQFINVRGNTIRQIILPDSLNLDSLLVDEEDLKRLRRSGQVVDDFGKKRRRDYGTNPAKRVRRGGV